MASGSSAGRANNSGSKGSFDFASDDILCSYEEYDNHQESSNRSHSDPVIGINSSKDFHKTRLSRSSMFPTSNVYTHPEDSLNQELITTVERTMKKYTDNLMRFLEGISSRLSQLELYCYNLDKSLGEMRSDLARENGETDAKLKSLDKHLQEVHRSVQILRDKQELADTQKELAKLHLAQKESSGSQQEEKSATPTSSSKKAEEEPETHNQHLALALPHQIAAQTSLPIRSTEQQQSIPITASLQTPSKPITQQPPYYLPATQMPNAASQPQLAQGPYSPADSQYRAPQMARNQGQVNQPPQVQQFPQYQQQWSQPPVQPAQPQPVQPQTQIRAPPSTVYPAYIQSQLTNPPPQEQLSSSMPMQVPTLGYGGPGRPIQTQPPPQPMTGVDGYPAPGTHPPIPSGGSYMIYDSEGGRPHHSPSTHFSQGGYPPAGLMIRGPSPSQFGRSHPYSELIDKLVSMGYRGDHVASVIQRLEESGQAVDFNAVLDRLNGHGSGGSQRAW